MADEAPPNSQQHARANIHVRQVRRTDGRVKTLEQTRRPQLIQTPVISFLALQHPSTPPDLRQASGRRHAYSPQVWLWLKKKTLTALPAGRTLALQLLKVSFLKSLSRKWLYIENAVRCIWLLKSNPNAKWIQTSPATPFFPSYFLSSLPSFFVFYIPHLFHATESTLTPF